MKKFTISKKVLSVSALCTTLLNPLITSAHASAPFSLQDLSNLEVTSVSKQPERAFDAAAALHVITSEDIRRSGAESIPEVLRLATGIQVARIDSNKWAISSRGFNEQLGEKILVLLDGRSLYLPEFSGVLWDVQDVIIEDIKRIEVIRGPGATLWGANAVNGVINIITKDASETQGMLVSSGIGNDESGITSLIRHGGKTDDDLFYRLYAKTFKKGEDTRTDGQGGGNGWQQQRFGFRTDWGHNTSNKFTVQGDAYRTEKDRRTQLLTPTLHEVFKEDSNNGGNIIARWNHTFDNASESSLQLYYDLADRNHLLLTRKVQTFDVDLQHTIDLNNRNELVWGGGYRHYSTKLDDTEYYSFAQESYKTNLYNAFIQNKYAVIPDKFFLIAGAKLEHTTFTGFEFQPNIRASWHPTVNQTVWAAVSRAVRTPSIGENDITLINGISSQTGGFQKLQGNRFIRSEDLLAYEIGYRARPASSLFFDISAYYNKYSDLRSAEIGNFTLDGRDVIIPVANNGQATIFGAEIAANWDATRNWRLSGTYTWTKGDLDIDILSDKGEGRVPSHQFTLRSHYNITPNVEWDTLLYYVGELDTIDVDAYTRLDVRLGWRPEKIDGVELSLVGQNLLDDRHQEFSKPSNTEFASEISRTIYAKIAWKF